MTSLLTELRLRVNTFLDTLRRAELEEQVLCW